MENERRTGIEIVGNALSRQIEKNDLLQETVNKIVNEEIVSKMENISLSDLSADELLLIKKYWEFQNQRCINRINAIDNELLKK